jgi:4'-phosphopantetheinyl transferase EntD
MQESVVILEPPILNQSPRLLCFRCQVKTHSIEQVVLANIDEVSTFVMDKRRNEHLTGRWLLAQALEAWGINPAELEVRRNQYRAPSLAYLQGIWKNTPLPSISIGHSQGWAYVALIDNGWTVGIDGEPDDRRIAENAFDMMASGEELEQLRSNPHLAIRTWTAKEALQKAMRLGMNLNPRKIQFPIGVKKCYFSIENLNFQLVSWTHEEAHISLAWGKGNGYDSVPEDELLERTRKAMENVESWGVGCSTTRNNL